ncbi:MAG: Trm112 family protein [Phycisphaerae bacterium]
MTINSELLEILVCPACREKVELKDEFIVCTACRRRYPIRDEIPIMLINEALPPEEEK